MNNNGQNNGNVEQNDYYGNDSYYSNNNYSDSSYEEKKNGGGLWWKILLIVLILLIIILLLLKFCVGGSGGKSAETKYTELTERICTAAKTYISNNPTVLDSASVGSSAVIKFRTLADANLVETQIKNPYYDGGLFKKGTQPQYYSLDSSVRVVVQGDGTYRCELVDNSKDVTAPELRLNGDAEITLAVGTEFEDPGYTATDDFDGDVTSKVVRSGNVDSSKAGTYTLTYTVQDAAGNVTSKTRTVIYEEYANIEVTLGSVLDTVTPMISLKGSNPYCMVMGSQYVEPGAVATDNVDGNITDRISVTNKVTGNLMGAFRVVYKVEDSSGNQAIAYRAVIVTTSCPSEYNNNNTNNNTYVNNAPVITLVGKNSVTINKGTEYIDLGATAYDKEDGDITSRIVTDTTNVNTNSAGVYKVIYRVTDSDGKTSNATRTVTVKEPTTGNPSVRFTENKSNITVDVGEGSDSLLAAPKAVNENGVAVAVSMRIEDYTTKKAVSAIDWNKAGKYRVIYTATHGNGSLKQTKSIIVTIYDDIITIGGKTEIEVPLREERCALTEADLVRGGVTFKTNGNATPIVTIDYDEEDSGMVCMVGTYEVIVKARIGDATPAEKQIKVNVVDKGGNDTPAAAPSKVIITGNTANASDVYNNAGKWVGGATTGIDVSFKATPAANTELSYFEYSTNCADTDGTISKLSATTGVLRWSTEGKNNVCIRAVNTDGVAGEWSNPVKLYLDLTGPKAEFTHTWKDDKDDWHNSKSLTLSYKASDNGAGLDHFEYTYDDVKAKKAEDIVTYDEATGKLTVYENTEPTRPTLFVYVRAVDKVGNKGEWTKNPAYANIDTVKPDAPIITVEGNNTALVKLKATFNDGVSVRPSGFGKLVYTLNGGTELEEASKTITMPTSSTKANYDVRVWAVDKAGNKSDGYANQTVTVAASVGLNGVTIKNGSNDVTGKACGSVGVQGELTLTATPNPTNATVGATTWSISDTNIATIKDGKITGKKIGTATVTAKMGDKSATCTLTVTEQVVTCKAGTYLPKGASKCAECPAGSYCPGGSYPIKPSSDTGRKACATGYTSSKGASKCTAKTVTVVFHRNDGTSATVQQVFKYGAKGNRFGYNTNGTPKWEQTGQFGKWTRSGYKLLGWSANSKATSKTWGIYSNVTDNWINSNSPKIDIYAVWQKNSSGGSSGGGTTTIKCSVANCSKCSKTNYCSKCVSNDYTLSNGKCTKKSSSGGGSSGSTTKSCTCYKEVNGTCSGSKCSCSSGSVSVNACYAASTKYVLCNSSCPAGYTASGGCVGVQVCNGLPCGGQQACVKAAGGYCYCKKSTSGTCSGTKCNCPSGYTGSCGSGGGGH